MVDIRPLTRILMVVGLVSVVYGYFRAYAGPFFVVTLHEAGYSHEAIAAIMSTWAMFWAASSYGILALVVLVSYRYGSRYRLTLLAGFVLIVLVYSTEFFGNLVGAIVYQIQTPRFPIVLVLLPELLTSHAYVVFSLIGVLAANYTREIRQKLTPEKA